MDWSFAKSFNVFNITNRANFAVPAGARWSRVNVRRATAGRITRTVTPSRQMQFGLKFVF